jgi:hypothetical protein
LACLQCGVQFQLEQRPGQTVLRMQPSASEPSWHRLRSHLPWLLPAPALLLGDDGEVVQDFMAASGSGR